MDDLIDAWHEDHLYVHQYGPKLRLEDWLGMTLEQYRTFVEHPESLTTKRLACTLCVVKDDKVLAVCRRGTTDDWGLVGGG